MKKFSAFQIKIFMALFMVLDHLKIVPGLVPPVAEGVIHLLTRCVAPWFAYMAVEGFLHTSNRTRYNVRLFLWAAFMEIGNLIVNLCYHSAGIIVYNNIFLTLAFGVLLLNLLFHEKNIRSDTKKKKFTGSALRITAAVATMAAGMFFSEGGIIMLPFILITYILRNKKKARNLTYTGFALLLFAEAFQWYPENPATTIHMLLYNSDWAFPLVIPFLYLYNGKRGNNSWLAKYFFYIFYPAHIWLLATIAFIVSAKY